MNNPMMHKLICVLQFNSSFSILLLLTTPLNKNYWAETESLSAETDTSHLNKTKHRDRDFTCGAETVRIGYSAEMTSNQKCKNNVEKMW
jgi:hypothetical protein